MKENKQVLIDKEQQMIIEIEDNTSQEGSDSNEEDLKNSEDGGTKLQEGVIQMDKDEQLKEVHLTRILVIQLVSNIDSNNDVIQKVLTAVVKLVKEWK